jgi:FkbM family methyltransferase
MLKPAVVIKKEGVRYRLAPSRDTYDFCRNRFPTWEAETFELFRTVRNPNCAAIDLGAWIGTTAIWLSKHFKEVIAVEPDRQSIPELAGNLSLSGCDNVTLCDRPITVTGRQVIFGPRGSKLNESTSCVKAATDNDHDYRVKSITFNQFIRKYTETRVSLIKCDIEGGEEDVLEDILYYAWHNQCDTHLSFHCHWWKNPDVSRFASLLSFFKACKPGKTNINVVEALKEDPLASFLLMPVYDDHQLTKSRTPVLIKKRNRGGS